jgi:8-oxo-dGTP pyrophosphatase MutT (NUDIX family)
MPRPQPDFIRPIAICILRREGDIFVFEGVDSIKGEVFYRPLGGAIEFGETGLQAIKREIHEEINAEITHLAFMGIMENIYTYMGNPGHEIVLVYEGDFCDSKLYNQQVIMGTEDNGEKFKAMWKSVEDFAGGKAILYPNGLLELISKQ